MMWTEHKYAVMYCSIWCEQNTSTVHAPYWGVKHIVVVKLPIIPCNVYFVQCGMAKTEVKFAIYTILLGGYWRWQLNHQPCLNDVQEFNSRMTYRWMYVQSVTHNTNLKEFYNPSTLISASVHSQKMKQKLLQRSMPGPISFLLHVQ